MDNAHWFVLWGTLKIINSIIRLDLITWTHTKAYQRILHVHHTQVVFIFNLLNPISKVVGTQHCTCTCVGHSSAQKMTSSYWYTCIHCIYINLL